jgi:hypothetical protein
MPSRTQSSISGSSVGVRRSVGDNIGSGAIGPSGDAAAYSLRLDFVRGLYEVTRVDGAGAFLALDFKNNHYVQRS